MHNGSKWKLKFPTANVSIYAYSDIYIRRIFLKRFFLTAKFPHGESSLRQSFLTAKIPYGEFFHGEIFHDEMSHDVNSYDEISGHDVERLFTDNMGCSTPKNLTRRLASWLQTASQRNSSYISKTRWKQEQTRWKLQRKLLKSRISIGRRYTRYGELNKAIKDVLDTVHSIPKFKSLPTLASVIKFFFIATLSKFDVFFLLINAGHEQLMYL